MHLPASLKSCRTRPSPAIRSSLCRSTPQPRTTCRGFACSAFRRDRSKKNSKRCSSKANEETQSNPLRFEQMGFWLIRGQVAKKHKGFTGDGAVASYLNNKGGNH